METSLPPAQLEGVDLPTCRETQCNGHGSCVAPSGSNTHSLCNCDLGYQGEFCDDTVHGVLSLPLTVSVLVVIIVLVIVAFVVAKLRQKQKKNQRRSLAEKHGYNIAV